MMNANQKIRYYENIIDDLLREYLVKRKHTPLPERLHLVDAIMRTEERLRFLYNLQQLISKKKAEKK